MKPFNLLTKMDIEYLRRLPAAVTSNGGVNYCFTAADLAAAKAHIESLYSGCVRLSFAAKILLLDKIY